MSQKKQNPSKGRSVVLRAEAETHPSPAMVVLPVHPTPVDASDAASMEAEERARRFSSSTHRRRPNRPSKPSRQNGGTEVTARPDPGKPDDIEVNIGPGGLWSRSRWPIPWAFALIVIATISQKGVLDPHLPWIVGTGLFLLLLWLGLFQLRIGRQPPA